MRSSKRHGPGEVPNNTPRYSLTEAAQQDMIEIALYGDDRFGIERSNRYIDMLKSHFTVLAARPRLYPEAADIRPGYRRSVCGRHSVYYRIEEGGIVIVRILRGQDPAVALS